MRERLPFLGLWLLATALATAVGLVAVSTVGIVLRGSGPIGERFSTVLVQDVGRSASSWPPSEAVLTHPAAVLRARCEGRSAELLEVRPGPGYTTGESDPGPDEDVDVDLLSPAGSVRLEVYCNEGAPRLVVE